MNAIDATGIATLWPHEGTPERLVWFGRRWRISDTPTELTEFLYAITHPPALDGWRFQATNEDGESRVFDVARDGDRWAVLRVYE
ncbi:MAG: hypothetical protein JWQ64_2539 [Subtercola sp.]|nr:hypothetical protein [Subtercola sp.]